MMWEKVDISNVKFMSPSQVDNALLKFHRVGGCIGWYRVLNALTDVDHQTTARCCCHLSPDAQSQSQGIVRWDPPGRSSFPGSAPRQFYSFPRRL